MDAGTVVLLVALLAVVAFMVSNIYNNNITVPFLGNLTPGGESVRQYNITTGGVTTNITSSAPLLFQNIRFGRMPVKFYMNLDSASDISWFGEMNVNDILDAFAQWSVASGGKVAFARTYSEGDAQIIVDWNKSIAPLNGSTNRAVGEGGPTLLVDTGLFNLTLKGEIHLLPAGTQCLDTERALHELGHVLGFDHTDDPYSVMYPYESCRGEITSSEAKTLGSIYSLPPKPQFYLSNISAVVRGGYVDLNFSIENVGVAYAPATQVVVYAGDRNAASSDLAGMDPGTGVSEYFRNVRTYSGTGVSIVIDPDSLVDVWYRNLTYANITLS